VRNNDFIKAGLLRCWGLTGDEYILFLVKKNEWWICRFLLVCFVYIVAIPGLNPVVAGLG